MAVTINEFEVVTESASPVQATNTSSAGNEGGENLSPEQLDMLIRREMERLARVWAH